MSITEDNVQFINGLPFYTHLLSKYESNPHMWSSPFLKPVEKPKNFHELSIDKTKVLESLYTQITTIFKDKLPDLILIDHINPLLLQNDIFEFIQSLKNLTGKGCTVLLMIHEDEENFQIINFMNHISDLSFSIKGLPTGYSKDVHGEVTFHTENEITLHFKTFDQNVKLFVPGSSNN